MISLLFIILIFGTLTLLIWGRALIYLYRLKTKKTLKQVCDKAYFWKEGDLIEFKTTPDTMLEGVLLEFTETWARVELVGHYGGREVMLKPGQVVENKVVAKRRREKELEDFKEILPILRGEEEIKTKALPAAKY